MGTTNRRWLLALACSGVAPLLTQPAFAQATSSEPSSPPAQGADGATGGADARTAGDIIVTAQKRSERLRDVPMSITAASGEQLKAKGITNPEQFEKLVPGFTFNKTLFGQPVFFIRGVGFNDTSLGVSPAVSAYTDQLPIPFSPMARGVTLDLERVEALKGPQGTLFGQNSTGGAINFIAAKPTDELKAGFDLTYGRFDEVDAEAFVSGPISSTVSARLALRNEYRGDWQKGYTVAESLGRKDFHNARLIVDWQATSKIKVELMATGWQDKSDAQQQQFVAFTPLVTGPTAHPLGYPIETFPPAPNDARAAAWDLDHNFRMNNYYYQFGARIDAELTDTINFTSLTSFSRFGQYISTDFDTTNYPLSINTTTGTIHSFSQEGRFSGSSSDDRVKWMVGGNYQKDRVYEDLFSDPSNTTAAQIGPILLNSFEIQNLQKIDTKAVFASLDFRITDNLTAQGSGRYTWQKRDFAGCARDTGNGVASAAFGFLSTIFTGMAQTIPPGVCVTLDDAGFPLPIVTDSLDQNNFSWRASLNWKPNPDTLIYGNITKGYKSGSFSTISYVKASEAAPVGQESVLAYEVGAKASAFDRKLQLTGAAFYYDYRDKQLNGYTVIQPFGPIPGLVSIPKSAIKGGEISATLLPFSGFTISANATYVHTRIKTNPINPTGSFGNVADFRGQRFPDTPKWQGTADAQYRFHVSSSLDSYLGSSLTYHSSTSGVLLTGDPAVAANEALLKIPSYLLLDLRAGVEVPSGAWRLEVFGRNVTNKFYLSGVARNSDYLSRYTGFPVTYGVSLYYRFN